MSRGLIARRYALALYEFAERHRAEEATAEGAQRLLAAADAKGELMEVLLSPVVSCDRKAALLRSALDPLQVPTLERFLQLVLAHDRAASLLPILRAYIHLYKERHNRCDALLRTAAPVDAAFLERLRVAASRHAGREVTFRHEIDPELLGGYLLRIEDEQLDVTLRHQLNRIRQELGAKTNRIL